MNDLDRDLSRKVAEAMDPAPAPKQCYLNAFRAWSTEPIGRECLYVEGVARVGDTSIRHGWIETPDGRVVDVTPSFLGDDRRADYRYVAHASFSIHDVLAHLDEGGTFPIQEDSDARR